MKSRRSPRLLKPNDPPDFSFGLGTMLASKYDKFDNNP